MLELWTCAHGGLIQQEVDVLELDRWHNWGSWQGVPPGPGRIPLASLRLNELPSNWPKGAGLVMVGNEPQNPGRDGDGYLGRARAAGYHAANLGQLIAMESGQDGDHFPLLVAGNFWAGDLTRQRGTCYDGTPQTKDAGIEYWNEYFTGWHSNYSDFDAWGIHYYTRGKPPVFDADRCIRILQEYHDWHGGDVYLTELGMEAYRFAKDDDEHESDLAACKAFLDKLIHWAMTKPWMRAICWCQWPHRGSDARLVTDDWRRELTPLGRHYRDLGRFIRASETPPATDPPDEEDKPVTWELLSRHEFEVPPTDELYRVTVERRL